MRATFRVSTDKGSVQPVTAPPLVSTKSNTPNILDKEVVKPKQKEVSLSSFAFLFNGIVQYYQERVTHGSELEQRYSLIFY
jgi:hypothetical protein